VIKLFTHLLISFSYNYDRYSHYSSRPATPAEKRAALLGIIIFFTVLAMVVAWIVARKLALKRKKEKVEKFIHEFQKNDPFWDEKIMLEISHEIFYNVQNAWVKRSYYYLGDYITDELKLNWENAWEKMAKKNYGYQAGKIEIKSVTIIGAEDSSNNEKDTFSVEISAYLKRYMYERSTMSVLPGYTSQLELVTDVYMFVRRENKWKLNHIDYDASLLEVITKEVKIEKPGKPNKV
jgi:predicted lipid-binding transport protein (Tim44 family)